MYTEAEAETAMCLWEAFLDELFAGGSKAEEWRKRYGTAECRSRILQLARQCEKDWQALTLEEAFEWDTFDWDFVPDWLYRHL